MHFSNISRVYFQKYSLYWHYAVLIFTSKLRDPPPPQTILSPPPPTKIEISGANALKRPTMLYEVVKVICKVMRSLVKQNVVSRIRSRQDVLF